MEKISKSRNSNIEMLRILAMIGIILHHSVVHSNLMSQRNSVAYIFLSIIEYLGTISNNIFIIITGYYMYNKKIDKKSLIKLIFEVIFYSYLIFIIYILFSAERNKTIIIKSIFPILSNSYWFITSYVLLYISIPYINKFIEKLDKGELKRIIIFLIIVFSILPTLTLLSTYFSPYIWFIALYLIGVYFKLYNNNKITKKIKIFIWLNIIALLIFKFGIRQTRIFATATRHNFMLFMISVSIFVFFITRKEWNNKFINYISSSVLGVYLIHDNLILRPIIWEKLNIQAYVGTPFLYIYQLSGVLLIFSICIIIDKIRIRLIEKTIMKLITRKIEEKEKSKEVIKEYIFK